MRKAKVVIYSSGGGSGPEQLILYSMLSFAGYKVVGIVVSSDDVECVLRARAFGIECKLMTSYKAQDYQAIVDYFRADFVFFSGWLMPGRGLNPQTTNVHPGLLPRFGGKGMFGDNVHEASLNAFDLGEITYTGMTMHFVTPYVTSKDYDSGPSFFQRLVPIFKGDTVQTLQPRVNKQEHIWQAPISDLVVKKLITWDGKNPKSLIRPKELEKLEKMYYPPIEV